MAKDSQVRQRSASRKCKNVPHSKYSSPKKAKGGLRERKCCKLLIKKEWEDSTCSVCMEFPHNAVLLLCSSYNKGCRPYMCATSCRFSNCLDQYKKAYTKVVSIERAVHEGSMEESDEKKEVTELLCPLCRGQVKGWTVVESARKYLNAKKRTCMQENCLFVGNYKKLRKHVKTEHPLARPREVDPTLEAKWTRLEHERERSDVLSTIRSSMPGAIVMGDYVIEGGNYRGLYRNFDELDHYLSDVFLPFESRGTGRGFHLLEEEDDSALVRLATAASSNRRRLVYGTSRRRRVHRRASGNNGFTLF